MSEQIVNEMIDRLRELQGSGEYVPLARRVTAGDGLRGGGPLLGDITVALSLEAEGVIRTVVESGGPGSIVFSPDLDEKVKDFLTDKQIAPVVFYRDFTLMEPPAASITTPPVRIDKQCRIARISCTVGTPGTQAVRATVDGTTITVGAGASQGTLSTNITKQEGNTIRVTIGATDAAGIVVSLRIEEPGVLPS